MLGLALGLHCLIIVRACSWLRLVTNMMYIAVIVTDLDIPAILYGKYVNGCNIHRGLTSG